MGKDSHLNEERRAFALSRISGSAPWLKPIDKQRHKTKIFKSGNSLAVRIPAGTRLAAGMEMELVVEDGQFLSYEPADQPRRLFNIAKVAGSATSLRKIEPEDRLFEERPLRWGKSAKDDEA
jgi:antitoxin VapB